MPQDQQTYKRAAVAAVIGFVAQLLLSIAVALMGAYTQSPAVDAAALHFFGGLPIWIILWILFHQHQLERAEALETEALARADASQRTAAIFEEGGQQLQLARRRLDHLRQWWLAIVSTLVGLYLLGVGAGLFYANYHAWAAGTLIGAAVNQRGAAHAGALAVALISLGFIAFLIARYVAGMTRVREWTLLRGGASYLMGDVGLVALLFVAVITLWLGHADVLAILALVIPALMGLLGLEMLLGLLLRLYRPRRPGEIDRPAFDARSLGWLTRPESLGKIIGEAVNYQFGFEISASWFYRLLARAILPLVLVAAAVLIGLTSLVIVAPQQKAVITRFGSFERIAQPGLSFKWPWPVGQARRYPVYRVQQIVLGSATSPVKPGQPILWTHPHGGGQEQYLLTAPSRFVGSGQVAGDAVSAELVGSRVVVKYRVTDLRRYATSAARPVALLEDLAARRISAYFAVHDIDALLAAGRTSAGETLRKKIQQDARRIRTGGGRGLGVNVVYVGLESVHPPHENEVAAKFHEQIDAGQEAQANIEKAKQNAISTLAEVAGSRGMALRINQATATLEQMRERLRSLSSNASAGNLKDKIAHQEVAIEKLMDAAGGKAAQLIYAARAYRWQHALAERARAMRVASEYQAYRQAPRYFRRRLYLKTLAEGLQDQRKTVIAGKKAATSDIRLHLEQHGENAGGIFNAK